MIEVVIVIGAFITGWVFFGFLRRKAIEHEIEQTALSQKKLELLFGPREWGTALPSGSATVTDFKHSYGKSDR